MIMRLKQRKINFKPRIKLSHSIYIYCKFASSFSPSDNRESSYLQAVSSAGVAHQITRDCSKGTRDECGCDNRPQGRGTAAGELSWEWGGCSDDFRYGIQFSKDFMDPSRSSEKSLSYYVRRHNNDAGRRVRFVICFFSLDLKGL